MKRDLRIHSALLFLLSLFFLLTAVNPSFYMDDSPEIVTAASGIGIAHPPGYPFYVLLGRLTSLSAPGSVPMRANLLAVLLACLGTVLLFRLLVSHLHLGTTEAFLLSLFWLTGISAFRGALGAKGGVYHLAAVLWLAQALSLLRGRAPLAAFLAGLALAHHWMTAVPAAAGLWLFVWTSQHPKRPNLAGWVRIASWCLLGCSLYLLLPLRAVLDPVLNYGDPSNLGRFLSHVSLRQFFAPSSTPAAAGVLKQWADWMLSLFQEYPAVAVLAVLGLATRFLLRSRPAFAWTAAWLLSVSAVAFFTRREATWFELYLRTQWFPTHLFLFVFAAWGWTFLFPTSPPIPTRERFRFPLLVALAALLVLLGSQRSMGHRQTSYTFNYDYAMNALRCVPRDGILFTKSDIVDFPCWYLQWSQGLRPDVAVVSVNSVPKPWFRERLSRVPPGLRFPDLDDAIRKDPRLILRRTAELNRPRPLFAAYNQLEEDRMGDAVLVPWGNLQRVLLPPDPPGWNAVELLDVWKGMRLRRVMADEPFQDPMTRKYQLADYATALNRLGSLLFDRARGSAPVAPNAPPPVLTGLRKALMESALDCFWEAIRIVPVSEIHLKNAGLACLWLDRAGEARAWLEKARAINPREVRIVYGLALAAAKQGDLTAAMEYYRQIARMDPDGAAALVGRQAPPYSK